MDHKKELFKSNSDKYGSNYKDHLLEQYKMYVEMMDRISARRQTANSFFLSINTALIGFTGFLYKGIVNKPQLFLIVFISSLGIIISYTWYRILRSYKDLNSSKFEIIHQIEGELPLALYDAEWTVFGKGKDPENTYNSARQKLKFHGYLFFCMLFYFFIS